jgi:predicted dehydrogenase/threonine dehydrogenase-like Zn-dependent dehydrogenase
MKQILQSLKTGATEVADVPCPTVRPGHLLIRSSRTLVSGGTERMLVDFGKAGWIEKARQQPEKVSMVLNKIRTDGLLPTLEAVFNKLDQPLPLGYCNIGCVIETGADVTSFAVGDRVVSNGKHAEVVSVPKNLCARVPEGVTDDEAAFTVLGAISLQGIRLSQPTLGEAIAVTGLGLIGLMTVQLLRAHGCRVLGIDFDADKLALARKFGAEVVNLAAGEDPVASALTFSRNRGVDAVIITASTRSNEPVHQAARMCRKRGRIVLVGVTGLELSRTEFYEKELSFQVSCSYGPGRYDSNYEEKGQDYPVGFVRWTEQRNLEAVLDMMASGRIDVTPLISHRFAIDEAAQAYELVSSAASSLGIMFDYRPVGVESAQTATRRTVRLAPPTVGRVACAFIGSGNYATAVLIPSFKAAGVRLKVVASSGGVSGVHAGRKFGFEETTTETETVFADPQVNVVVVATRHDSHARFACRALAMGKHVFVEKPLCLTSDEIAEIERVASASTGSLMVGFNRRFAPHIQRIKALLAGVREPKAFVMTVNAGAIPPEHWTQDNSIGGGRIIGEACHFIDLLRFLAGAPLVSWHRMDMASLSGDTFALQLRFADGSIGTVNYLANGNKTFPKERLEVFCSGRVLQLDNFRRLTGFGWAAFKKQRLWRQDKGQKACAAAFVRSVEQGSQAPIPFNELIEVSRAAIEIATHTP